jgi:hypothetical protein
VWGKFNYKYKFMGIYNQGFLLATEDNYGSFWCKECYEKRTRPIRVVVYFENSDLDYNEVIVCDQCDKKIVRSDG